MTEKTVWDAIAGRKFTLRITEDGGPEVLPAEDSESALNDPVNIAIMNEVESALESVLHKGDFGGYTFNGETGTFEPWTD